MTALLEADPGELAVAPPATRRARLLRAAPSLVIVGLLVVLPLILGDGPVDRATPWIPLAIATLGLNLLTGYNGQISAGHGALYGLGAYAAAIVVNARDGDFVLGVVVGAAVCFVAGLVIGLPALRIKGLYLALVTLSVASLFPDLVKQFESFTGGSDGYQVTSPQPYRGHLKETLLEWHAPGWSGLSTVQWRFYWFALVAVVCFVGVRNLVASRIGRAIVAIRDNEVAAEVNGVPVARVKIITFGLSSALAGIGGALFALQGFQVNPGSFTLAISLVLLVAMVGALVYGFFSDVVARDVLPERFKPATPLILGLSLVSLMLVAPGGIMGLVHRLVGFVARRRAGRASDLRPTSTRKAST
jgi:branched-chain amino acid transport system permease protein